MEKEKFEEKEFDFLTFLEQTKNADENLPKVALHPMIIDLDDYATDLQTKIDTLKSKQYKSNSKIVGFNENTINITGNTGATIRNINNARKARTLEQYSKQLEMIDDFKHSIERGDFDSVSSDSIKKYIELCSMRGLLKGENPVRDLIEYANYDIETLEKAVEKSDYPKEKEFFESLLRNKEPVYSELFGIKNNDLDDFQKIFNYLKEKDDVKIINSKNGYFFYRELDENLRGKFKIHDKIEYKTGYKYE